MSEPSDLVNAGARDKLLFRLSLVVLALLAAAVVLAWRVLRPGSTQPAMRLDLYPAAQGVDVRTESPAADAGCVGPLEVATFTTTHPITDVVRFYSGALAEGGWHTESEAGDATSWGGIYTRDGGHAVCLLNVFDIEGVTWTSIVCGDKEEPVDLP